MYAPLWLYSCLSPSLNKLLVGEQKVHLQCLQEALEAKKPLLAGFKNSLLLFGWSSEMRNNGPGSFKIL